MPKILFYRISRVKEYRTYKHTDFMFYWTDGTYRSALRNLAAWIRREYASAEWLGTSEQHVNFPSNADGDEPEDKRDSPVNRFFLSGQIKE